MSITSNLSVSKLGNTALRTLEVSRFGRECRRTLDGTYYLNGEIVNGN